MIIKSDIKKVVSLVLILCPLALYGQSNLAENARATADTSHSDYPATAAIDGNTADWTGWGVPTVENGEPQRGSNVNGKRNSKN